MTGLKYGLLISLGVATIARGLINAHAYETGTRTDYFRFWLGVVQFGLGVALIVLTVSAMLTNGSDTQ